MVGMGRGIRSIDVREYYFRRLCWLLFSRVVVGSMRSICAE